MIPKRTQPSSDPGLSLMARTVWDAQPEAQGHHGYIHFKTGRTNTLFWESGSDILNRVDPNVLGDLPS